MRQKLQGLEESSNPIRVSLIGCGRFGSMIAAQLSKTPGIILSVACDKDFQRSHYALNLAGFSPDVITGTDSVLKGNSALRRGCVVATDSIDVAVELDVDVVVEATGVPDLGALHCFKAIENQKHVVNVSVEADVLVGLELKRIADDVGVVYSLAYGDQPSIIDDLYDWAVSIGFEVVAAGKGTKYLPSYRYSTPDTALQHFGYSAEEAVGSGLNTQMYNSFVDGTKSAVEMCSVANMTGLVPDLPGMHFPPASIADLPQLLRPKSKGGILSRSGVVEVVSNIARDGVEIPNSIRWGVYIVITSDSPYLLRCLKEYGLVMDDTNTYGLMYRPYHLVGMEVPVSIAKAFLYNESTGTPVAKVAEVAATSKKVLTPGETLDGEGGYTVYGTLLEAAQAADKQLVPIGLCRGAKVKTHIGLDSMITEADVDLPSSEFIDKLIAR